MEVVRSRSEDRHETAMILVTLRDALSRVHASLQDPTPKVEHLSRWMCLIMSLKTKVPLLLFIL
jgi:hypothetical protein